MPPPDLRLDIVWQRLVALAEEQATALMRTAFSPIVREAGDLSAGIFDTRARMLAQAETGTPGHVNTMAQAVGHFLKAFPLEVMRPGDVFATNDPWLASGHLHDITVVGPCFHRGRPVALAAVTIHLSDVGGRGQGPDAPSVFEEGIFIPPMRLVAEGRREEALLALIAANVRRPDELRGDLESCFAALAVAARRIDALLAEFALPGLDGVAAHVLARSETAMRRALGLWPQGSWRARITLADGPEPIVLAAAVTIDETGIAVDFAGTGPAVGRGVNVPLAYAAAYASFALRCAIAPDVPNNAGSLSVIQVSAPEGCILNPRRPAPVAARHVVGLFIPDLVFRCLEQARPGRLPAEGAGPLWTVQLAGQDWSAHFSLAGGMGARPDRPGLAATAFPSGARAIPVEVIEATAPIVLWRKELREGSGGGGLFRGGDGQSVAIAAADGGPMRLYAMFARTSAGATGRAGGFAGEPGRAALDDGGLLAPQGLQLIPAGRRVVLELPGGGGMFAPANGGESR